LSQVGIPCPPEQYGCSPDKHFGVSSILVDSIGVTPKSQVSLVPAGQDGFYPLEQICGWKVGFGKV